MDLNELSEAATLGVELYVVRQRMAFFRSAEPQSFTISLPPVGENHDVALNFATMESQAGLGRLPR